MKTVPSYPIIVFLVKTTCVQNANLDSLLLLKDNVSHNVTLELSVTKRPIGVRNVLKDASIAMEHL